jgi:hypothetical protein
MSTPVRLMSEKQQAKVMSIYRMRKNRGRFVEQGEPVENPGMRLKEFKSLFPEKVTVSNINPNRRPRSSLGIHERLAGLTGKERKVEYDRLYRQIPEIKAKRNKRQKIYMAFYRAKQVR